MNGARELEQLKAAGFSGEEIAQHEADQRVKLNKAGFSQDEIDKHFGTQPANMRAVEQYFSDVANTLRSTPPQTGDSQTAAASFSEYLEAGWQLSVTGLDKRQKLPDITAEDAPWYGRLAANVATLAGDAPSMLTGAVLGGLGGTLVTPGLGTAIGAWGGSMALPMALRGALIQNIKNGSLRDTQDFIDRTLAIAWEGGKGFITGAATFGAGKAVGLVPIANPAVKTGAQLTAELATMTTIGHALEGQLPTAQAFLDGAILLGGLKGATHVSGKLMDIYHKTGKLPADVVQDATIDVTIKQSILSTNEQIPAAYKDLVPGGVTDAKPTAKSTAKTALAPGDLASRSEAEQSVLSRIAGEHKKPGYSWDKFYTDIINDLHPIFKTVEQLGGKDLPVEQHAGKLAQLTRGSVGKAGQALEFAIYDPKTLKNSGEGLKDRLRPVAEDLDGWRAYALAKRAVELDAEGIKTGVDIAAAKRVVADGKKNKPELERVSQKVTEYQDWLVDMLAEAGILSKEAVAAMKAAHKDYVPVYRLMEDGVSGVGTGGRVRNPIKGIKGSERLIIDPIESIIKNTYLYTQLADRNMVGRALLELAEKHPQGKNFLAPVSPQAHKISVTTPEINTFLKAHGVDAVAGEALSVVRAGGFTSGPDTVVVFRNGKREVFKVSRDLAEAFNNTDRATANLLVKVLSVPASMLRAGAILSPDFMARSLVREQFSAFINSDSGYVMVLDTLRGIHAIVGKNEAYQNWLKGGGANAALVNIDRAYIANKIFKLDEQTGFLKSAVNVLKSPLELLRAVSELVENSTRLGEAMRATKGEGRAAILEGGFASREITIDHARVGAQVRALSQMTAFWRPQVQGLDRIARKFQTDPIGTMAKVTASITLPSVLLWWANHDDPRWKELSAWEKDLFWIVMTDDHVYRIPKPFELGIIFGTLPERALDAIYDSDPKAFRDFGDTMVKNILPNFIPTFAAPVIEQATNQSALTGNAIIPWTLEGLLPQYQATPYTTEVAKALGGLIGSVPALHDSKLASPILAENYLRAWTGGLGMYALQLVDFGLRKSGVLPDPVKPADTLADIPFVKVFVVRYPSANAQPIKDFYDRFERSQRVINTVRHLAQQGNQEAALAEMALAPDAHITMTSTREALSNMAKFVRSVHTNPELSKDDKRQLIDATYYQMIQVAKLANTLMDELDKNIPKALLEDSGIAK